MILRIMIRNLGYLLVRLSDFRLGKISDFKNKISNFKKRLSAPNLAGDRPLEWAWVMTNLPEQPGNVLDFGCGDTSLGLAAAIKGGNVTGLDLECITVPYCIDRLKIRRGDILNFDFGKERFNTIINCSSVEHVGLAGRYSSSNVSDGDLRAMERLRCLLEKPNGIMLLTIPVGKDGVFHPFHRVYGIERLPLLLRGFRVIKKEFWSKRAGGNVWVLVDEEEALNVHPSHSFYALGLFILKAVDET